MRMGQTFLLASLILCQAGAVALAEPFDLIPTYIPAQPRDDGAALADLAPPSNRTTARLTYGDAVFARRSRVDRSSPRREARADDVALRTSRCPAQTARVTFRECDKAVSAFFRKNYVFTPSYVSAPQVFDQSPRRPSPVTSPITAFFYDPFR